MNELKAEVKPMVKALKALWNKAFAAIACLVLGILFGILHAESRIIDDCKFSSGFRVGVQSFTCQRRM
jgi:hypothetical protein